MYTPRKRRRRSSKKTPENQQEKKRQKDFEEELDMDKILSLELKISDMYEFKAEMMALVDKLKAKKDINEEMKDLIDKFTDMSASLKAVQDELRLRMKRNSGL